MVVPAFHVAWRQVHCRVVPRGPLRAGLQSRKDRQGASSGQRATRRSSPFTDVHHAHLLEIVLTCWGCMTWAYISRRLKVTCQSTTKKHVLCTNNHTCNAEALHSCWRWK